MNYKYKYLKYKKKYLLLIGGVKKCPSCTFSNDNNKTNCNICKNKLNEETDEEIKELEQAIELSNLEKKERQNLEKAIELSKIEKIKREEKNRTYNINKIKSKTNEIECSKCTLLNPSSNIKCSMCDTKLLKISDLENIEIHNVPNDGFCGYKALYNFIHNDTKKIKINTNEYKITKPLDKDFISFLKNIVKYNKDKDKKTVTIINTLSDWLKKYNEKKNNLSNYFNDDGTPKNKYIQIDKYGIPYGVHEIEIFKGLPILAYADDNILGKIGEQYNINIIYIQNYGTNQNMIIPYNTFKNGRRTVLLHNESCHWEWSDVTAYNNIIEKEFNIISQHYNGNENGNENGNGYGYDSGSSTSNKFTLDNLPGVDNENGHIKPHIQNLILMFGGKTNVYGLEIYKNEVLVQKLTVESKNIRSGTQSFILVPLIWNALSQDRKIRERIPDNWTKLSPELKNHAKIKEAARKLYEIPNWIQYAMFLLNNKNIKCVTNSFDDEKTIQENIRLQKEFNKNKYIKYKKKYLLMNGKIRSF